MLKSEVKIKNLKTLMLNGKTSGEHLEVNWGFVTTFRLLSHCFASQKVSAK